MTRTNIGCEIVGHDLTRRDEWSVWFRLDDHPGVRVVVTMLRNGNVVGFEVHVAGRERSYAVDPAGDVMPSAEPEVATPPDTGLTARLLREIPLGELADLARSRIGVLAGWREEGFEALGLTAADQARAVREQNRRPGRRGQPDRYYAELAVAYEAWQDTGARLKVLAQRLHLSESGLRTALHAARGKGFLTNAPKGRSGGEATEAARELLRRREADDES